MGLATTILRSRAVAALGTAESLALLIDAVGRAATAEARRTILLGVNEALKGRRSVDRPANWASP